MNSWRIVLAGASHPAGLSLREALESSSLQVAELSLLDPPPAGLLTRFRGEAKLAAPVPEDPSELSEALDGADLALLCGQSREMAPLQSHCARNGPPAVSLCPPGPDAPRAPCVFLGVNDEAMRDRRGLVYAPSAPACAAARLLEPVHAAAGLRRVVAQLLLPASEARQDGPEALCRQTIALLNLQPLPRDVFPEQRAFNLLPRGPASELEAEITAILGLAPDAVRASAVASPVFHGHVLSMWVETLQALDGAALEGRLAEAGIPITGETAAGPAEAAAAGEMRVTTPRGAPGGLWLWAAFDASSSGSLQNALALARTLLEGGCT